MPDRSKPAGIEVKLTLNGFRASNRRHVADGIVLLGEGAVPRFVCCGRSSRVSGAVAPRERARMSTSGITTRSASSL